MSGLPPPGDQANQLHHQACRKKGGFGCDVDLLSKIHVLVNNDYALLIAVMDGCAIALIAVGETVSVSPIFLLGHGLIGVRHQKSG